MQIVTMKYWLNVEKWIAILISYHTQTIEFVPQKKGRKINLSAR